MAKATRPPESTKTLSNPLLINVVAACPYEHHRQVEGEIPSYKSTGNRPYGRRILRVLYFQEPSKEIAISRYLKNLLIHFDLCKVRSISHAYFFGSQTRLEKRVFFFFLSQQKRGIIGLLTEGGGGRHSNKSARNVHTSHPTVPYCLWYKYERIAAVTHDARLSVIIGVQNYQTAILIFVFI